MDSLGYLAEVSLRLYLTYNVLVCVSGMEYPISTARSLTLATTTTTTTTMMSSTTRSPHACNPFDSHQCKNGGRCLQTVNNYRCLCSTGYTGAFCELSKCFLIEIHSR